MSNEKIRALSGITLAYVSDGEAGSLTVRYAPTDIISENDMTIAPNQYTKYLGILKEDGDVTIKADYDWALIKGQNGNDGITPAIGTNGNWWIGETDTGVKAEGKEGESGQTPFIGSNGNWWIGEGDTGISAEGYSPTVTTSTSEDGSTTVTVTNKDGSTTTTLVDGTARTDIDSLNDTIFGIQTFEYVLNGVTIPAYRREDGTYYYILNDEEITVAEADLVHDSYGELTSYQEGGIYEDLNNITNNIETIDTKVNSFNARETAIYNNIAKNSLIARKNARVEENSLIITNDTTTQDVANMENYLQLNSDSIIIYSNTDPAVTIGIAVDEDGEKVGGYMEMKGTSLFIAQESRLSTIRLRSAEKVGKLALVAGSDGHVSLREVLD